ncbi:RrF2 family transcriptional regulator [Pollutibacter soli]|uniref:RrF2 family transcriptional regulator n=1 Tax=Pollutibacter soli TaxID=3034157 RepID=UPI003013D3A6
MLSLTCKTAVKAVLFLASRNKTGTNAGIKEIAENIEGNEHTVGKLLQTLVKEGIINSVKGPFGGFHITTQQLKKPIITIVEAIDGKNVFKECGLGLSRCSSTHPCPIHNEFKIVRDQLQALFLQKKIIDLCENVNLGLAHLF